MADLDDLLGGGGGGGADDLLGGGGGGADDLLGGGGGAAAMDMDLLGGGGLDDALLFGGGGDFDFSGGGQQQQQSSNATGGPPIPSLPPRPAKKLALNPTTPSSEALQKYISSRDAPVYFLRFISVAETPGDAANRKRYCFLATNKELILMTTPTQTERTIPIQNIIGIILSVTEAPRRFGAAGQEVHVLMHVRGAKDIYLILGREEGNGLDEGTVLSVSQGFVAVLTALCSSFGETLPVSTLKRECETLESFFSPVVFTDDDLRSKFHQALAARTMQLSEISLLERDERSLDIAIATLKNSEKGATVGQITQEISQQEELIASLQRRERDAIEETKKVAIKVQELKDQLVAEDARRMNVIKAQSASVAQEQLLKHVAEYNLQKKNHGREMLRIKTITNFLDRYARETSLKSYDARNVALRIDDLTDMLHYLQGAASQRTELNSKVVKALTENRRRTLQLKELIKKQEEYLKTIEETQNLESLPHSVMDCEEPENIDPIVVDLENAVAGAGSSHTTSSRRQDVQAIAAPTTTPAAAINLDDDDDDI